MCLYCSADMHYMCLFPPVEAGECCCKVDSDSETSEAEPTVDFGIPTVGKRKHIATGKPVGRPPTADKEIVWQESSGRRRALLVKQRDGWIAGHPCEWAYLKFAGGGVEPIIGCKGNPSKPIHHGPDKSTLNNEANNLHAICSVCHSRWHACNDKYYDSERPDNGAPYLPLKPFKQHDPITPATDMEIDINDWEWVVRRRKSRVAIARRKDYSEINQAFNPES